MRAVQSEEAFIKLLLVVGLLTIRDKLLSLCKILCGKLALHVNKTFYQRLILLKHLVVALGNRT